MKSKKSHSEITLILCWIVFFLSCTLTHSAQQISTSTDTGKYTLDRWRAVMLIQDAYQKILMDVLVDSLESRVDLLENANTSLHDSFNNQLTAERNRFSKQIELTTFESSMKEFYKQEARKYRRQRNITFAIGCAAGFYGISRVLKPP
jgi:hypothetical protein